MYFSFQLIVFKFIFLLKIIFGHIYTQNHIWTYLKSNFHLTDILKVIFNQV
jgi:hypothetical protein